MILRSEEKAKLAQEVLGAWIRPYLSPRLDGKSMEEQLAAEDRIVQDMKELTGGRLFDDVIAACADPAVQRLMLELYAPEGYAVGACFGGTHETVDRADIDNHHYRCAKTIGTSGCSTDAMKTSLEWIEAGRLSLEGFSDPRHWTFRDDPKEFLTVSGARKPVLHPWD